MTSKNFIQPNWPAPKHIKAYTTLRDSKIGEIATPGQPGNINRQLLKDMLQLPEDPIWIKQVHSATAVKATPENHEQAADAVFTAEPNKVCAVLTADCLPVLLTNRQGTHVAAIHAGWRGLADGVIEATLDKLPVAREDILAWLGPAIGPTKFEVRKDVYDIFTHNNPEAMAGFTKISNEQWLANLYTLARLRLAKYGVQNTYGGEYCTHSEQQHFFSYRRDGRINGKIISLVWIADSGEQR